MPLALLVVDDEPQMRGILEQTFQEAGYAVATASDGSHAIDLFDRGAIRPDALIVDLNLGRGPDGWEVARLARERQSKLAIVYITGGRGLERRPAGTPDGITMVKPFTSDQILSVISALLVE